MSVLFISISNNVEFVNVFDTVVDSVSKVVSLDKFVGIVELFKSVAEDVKSVDVLVIIVMSLFDKAFVTVLVSVIVTLLLDIVSVTVLVSVAVTVLSAQFPTTKKVKSTIQ